MLITCSFGTRNTGADVRYQILNADKSVWVSRRSTGVTELLAGSGVFGVEVGDTILAGRTVVWDIDGTDKSAGDSFPTPPIVDVGEIDWSALWGTMPTGINIQVISPVYLGGDVTIVAGDDYKAADNRALSWVDKSNIWPDLSGATFKLTISHQAKVVHAQSVSYNSIANSVWTELTSSVTEILPIGKSPFDIQATLVNNSKVTLVIGVFRVINDNSV